MPQPTLIGKVRGQSLADLKQWCKQHRHLLKPSVSRYAPGRQELWIRRQCDLRKECTITPAFRDERIEALGERLLPEFHSGLLLLYPPQTQIRLHRDHKSFTQDAATVNLGRATFLMACHPRKGEKLQPERTELEVGDCLRFNSKLLHGIEPVPHPRWCVCFFRLKPEYLKELG